MEEGRYLLLKSEIDEKYKTVKKIHQWIKERAEDFSVDQAKVDSMGYRLHNLYGAYEELFEVITDFFENQIEGSRYHRDLLFRMKVKIEKIRPNLLSEETYLLLDEIRRFRHFFRHAYGIELDPDRIKRIIDMAIKVDELFEKDLNDFMTKVVQE